MIFPNKKISPLDPGNGPRALEFLRHTAKDCFNIIAFSSR